MAPARPNSNHKNHTKPDNHLSKVKEDILTVTKAMQNNMSKVLDRGSKLEDLQDKTGTRIVGLVCDCKRSYATSCNFLATCNALPHLRDIKLANIIYLFVEVCLSILQYIKHCSVLAISNK